MLRKDAHSLFSRGKLLLFDKKRSVSDLGVLEAFEEIRYNDSDVGR